MTEEALYLRLAGLTVRVKGYPGGKAAFGHYAVPAAVPDVSVELPETLTEQPVLALHRAVAETLIPRDVLLFHASAVAVDGEGFAFTAPSGTGKSTLSAGLAKLMKERLAYVNDDKPFLVFRPKGVFIAGSPWSGKHLLENDIEVPLKGITFLKQAKENRISAVKPEDAFLQLLRQIYMPETKENVTRTLALIERLVTDVPCYSLDCTLGPAAPALAYDTMKRGRK